MTSNATANNVTTLPSTPNPQTSKEVIAANVQLLIEQLEAGHSEGLTAYLTAMGRFHNYSFGNILEIARQMPEATRVAGLYAWNQLGRCRYKEAGDREEHLHPILSVPHKGGNHLTWETLRVRHAREQKLHVHVVHQHEEDREAPNKVDPIHPVPALGLGVAALQRQETPSHLGIMKANPGHLRELVHSLDPYYVNAHFRIFLLCAFQQFDTVVQCDSDVLLRS
ncbi:hypothetical protein Terro_3168 [Terriglobus roseus DSM 18391]|uniref:Uncharacterized protein n=1 Tax=Terriglobus roseus (strain DSM 18391 / NRRL B-41598 / KBS 63) TaxID=926566 RepID=I3ZJH4_TERRK|nr:hypothetical protein Terro_3168 [Terriglobus roseus DSM 18391]